MEALQAGGRLRRCRHVGIDYLAFSWKPFSAGSGFTRSTQTRCDLLCDPQGGHVLSVEYGDQFNSHHTFQARAAAPTQTGLRESRRGSFSPQNNDKLKKIDTTTSTT